MKTRYWIIGFITFCFTHLGFSQSIEPAQFDSDYKKMVRLLSLTQDSIEHLIYLQETNYQLNDLQKAQLNLLKVNLHSSYDFELNNNAFYGFSSNTSKTNGLLDKAIGYLQEARPVLGIPLVLEYLETTEEHSDSATLARIILAEGYRKIKEYEKGIKLLNKVLDKDTLSLKNKAYACNRIAALYAECGTWLYEHRYDSTLKYSHLCIAIAEENGFTEHLAASQNELTYYYLKKKKYQLALSYGTNAYDNFMSISMKLQAMNVAYNIAKIYYGMNKPFKAIRTIEGAMEKLDINENQNLFVGFYISLAKIYHSVGNCEKAYEYNRLGRLLQAKLSNANIRNQIYDLAAKYETEKKENENTKLLLSNEIKKLKLHKKNSTIRILAIVLSLIAVLLIVIIRQLYIKRKAYNHLVKANLNIVKAEQDYNQISEKHDINRNLSKLAISEVDHDEHKDLLKNLESYMLKEKPYLDSSISLDEISHKIGTNRTYLSKLINEQFNKNFNDFINEFRIQTARQILADPKKNHISIEGVGQMSGFNSRSTFFFCFKKHTGISPSYFRKMIK